MNKIITDILAPLDSVPNTIMIFKSGITTAKWISGKEDNFILDEQSANDIIKNFKALKHDMVIDWEHQSEHQSFSSPDGTSPAAGWITDLVFVKDKGLFANVNWTERAVAALKSREYRYFSPVFSVTEDNKINEIFSIGLTNTPAILGIKPIAAKKIGVTTMTPEELIALILDKLGLPADATQEELLLAIDELQTVPVDSAPASPDSVPASENADVVSSSVPEPDKWVSANIFKENMNILQHKLNDLMKEKEQNECSKFIDHGMRQGKIVSDTKEVWESLFKNDKANSYARLEKAPVIASVEAVSNTVSPTMTTRQNVIANACTEYDDNIGNIHCTKKQYINEYLRENKMESLDKEEIGD